LVGISADTLASHSRNRSMLKVALTGNIASGKTTVARVWASLGAAVIDADGLARRAVEPGSRALKRIAARWGEGILEEDGRLDRRALRELVFADARERRALEEIVHPEVGRLRDEELDRLSRERARVVVADIPLLFEAGLKDRYDLVVLVDASEDVRRERLIRDRGLGAEEADRMIAAQMPAAEKRERADAIIVNEGTPEELETRAAEVWRWVMSEASAREERAHG
jgi:dephospho-CoA kinase